MSDRRLASGLCLLTAAAAVPAFASGESSTRALIVQNYPSESLARGEQGTVAFLVQLDRDARIDTCVVTKSSGYPRLDAATCDVLVKYANFSPAEAKGARVATSRTGNLEWRLPDSYRHKAAAAAPRVNVTPAELEAQRLICKRTAAPGSLTRLKTYCLTKDEWA